MRDLIGHLQSVLGETAFMQGPWAWTAYVVIFLIGGLIMVAWMGLMALIWTYGERRIAGFIQARLGPNRVGWFGCLQPLADAIKLLAKEDTIPAIASKFLYTMAPLVVFVGAFLPFAALPFAERLVVVDMELALYFILGFEALEVIGVLMAGWAPGSKWSLYGGMRLAAQMLSYEIPMTLCALVIIILSGSLNLGVIVDLQSRDAFGMAHPWILGWWVFRSPAAAVAFVLFYVGGLASTKRAPFDLPEAESELVAGYHTEYSGMRFAYFFMAEYASMYLICALASILFLGGWHAPIPRPELTGASGLTAIAIHQAIGAANMILKSFALYFVMIWVRWTLPRIRIDQVLYICLKVLLPFGLACVVWALVQAAI